MTPSIRTKLERTQARFKALEKEMAELIDEKNQIEKLTQLSKEYAQLQPLVTTFATFIQHEAELVQIDQLHDDADPDIRALIEDEGKALKGKLEQLSFSLNEQLLMKDSQEALNVFLEIRAGTGGDEAGLFVADLLRMYIRYTENKGWNLLTLSSRPGELGGYKEVICRVEGEGAYGTLKFESGVHRVQRIPDTESQGRIHTSACTVAVLPEPPSLEAIEINRKDLRIDTFRASGAGGQHVNKTDSAIRITHLPTKTVVECQDERSQHKNKLRAMSLLQAKLLDAAQEKIDTEQAQSRKLLVGGGDRSERIRTYNFPQRRVTDHRIGLTLYRLSDVLEGDLSLLTEPLRQEDRSSKIASMAEQFSEH